MVHAAKHASAHRIMAVTPWYGYSRQDKKSAPREPISARLVAEMLETAGIDRMVTMDLHAGQLQGFFSKPVDHMTAMPILTQFVQDRLGNENLVIIAPDAGRVKLVRKFAQKVGAPYALMEKERPAQQVAEIGYVIGEVKGKTAIIVDDIIATGGTLSAAAQTVLDEGAERVFAVATHGLFSGNAFEILDSGPLAGIVVTDTVPLREGAPRPGHPAHVRGHPRGLDPPHLHRRLGVGDLRGREPALLGRARRRMYELWLAVHIVCAVVWAGGAVAIQILGRMYAASGDVAAMLDFNRRAVRVATLAVRAAGRRPDRGRRPARGGGRLRVHGALDRARLHRPASSAWPSAWATRAGRRGASTRRRGSGACSRSTRSRSWSCCSWSSIWR